MSLSLEKLNILGAALEGESPLPKFRKRKPVIPEIIGEFPEELAKSSGTHQKILPYTMQDRYSRKREELSYKCVTLENEHLRAEFLPELGGRLHRLYDKKNKCDLLFTNTVIQPCNLAIRDAWLSGGIEWNIGAIGHTYTTCDNVFMARLFDENGEPFVRIYEFERLKSLFWQVDFHLPEGAKQLYTHVKMINPFPKATSTYWWSNVAVPDNGKTRVLASGENVISFFDGSMSFEPLPYLRAMPGDSSYPTNATRSFDFFIQPNYAEEYTWEAAAYDCGVTFFERSTPPLSFKKLYTWGSHRAGDHWQQFLSEDGKGYYAEIQAGIAPSQLHDIIMPANTTYEWTQVFGGLKSENCQVYNPDYKSAVAYLRDKIDNLISEGDLRALDERLKKRACLPVCESDLIHTASGFGALEIKRMAIDGDAEVPGSMLFPEGTVGEKEIPWQKLLTDGKLPDADAKNPPISFMISEKWLPHLEKSFKKEGGESWFSLYQYGIAVYDGTDNTIYASAACSDEDLERRAKIAEAAWKKSVEIKPSYFAYRSLGVLEIQRANPKAAIEYYKMALKIDGAYDDYALSHEYLELLVEAEEYEKAWSFYSSLNEKMKEIDRMQITASRAAVKLDKTEHLMMVFEKEHHGIREGENTLTDVWFEYKARILAKERGIELTAENLDKLIDEAWLTLTPPLNLDFRQSYDRKTKYRI